MQVNAEDLKAIARLVADLCGVVLDETKGYLIESRLGRIARERGCATFSELYYKARYDTDPALRNEIVNAITTQETLFFRDTSPFEALQYKILPEMIDARARTAFPRRLRIWSAACSTGQEPYSIAMTLHELLPDVHSWDVNILATDISDAALAHASKGSYAPHEIQRGMPAALLNKYFVSQAPGWRVSDPLRALIKFQQINLLAPFPVGAKFDVIFCRNVAIYFSPTDRASLFQRLSNQLAPDGVLFVGASESLTDLGPRFQPQRHCRATFYRPNQALQAAASGASARR